MHQYLWWKHLHDTTTRDKFPLNSYSRTQVLFLKFCTTILLKVGYHGINSHLWLMRLRRLNGNTCKSQQYFLGFWEYRYDLMKNCNGNTTTNKRENNSWKGCIKGKQHHLRPIRNNYTQVNVRGWASSPVQLARETCIQLDNQGQQAAAQSFIKGAYVLQNKAKWCFLTAKCVSSL